jgi:hypothetical protein
VIIFCLAFVAAGCGLVSSAATPGPLETSTPGAGATAEATETLAVPGTETTVSTPAATETTAMTPSVTETVTTVVGTATTAVETPTTATVATPTGAATTVLGTPTVGGTATVDATPTVLTTPVAQGTEPISKAMQALLEVDAFRISTTITETGGTIVTATLEFVLPDRVRVLTDASEIVVIGTSGVWMREPGGQWQSLPGGSVIGDAFMAMIDPADVSTAMQNIDAGSVQSLGTETLNGKTMNVYQYTTSEVSGSEGLSGTTKMWVGADDDLPYRMETMTSGSGTFAGEQLSGAARIVQEYEYPTDLKIEAPM